MKGYVIVKTVSFYGANKSVVGNDKYRYCLFRFKYYHNESCEVTVIFASSSNNKKML